MAAILAQFFKLWKFLINGGIFKQIQNFFHYCTTKLRKLFSDKNKIGVRCSLNNAISFPGFLGRPGNRLRVGNFDPMNFEYNVKVFNYIRMQV